MSRYGEPEDCTGLMETIFAMILACSAYGIMWIAAAALKLAAEGG